MSGGVDSTVAAYLLRESGAKIVGATFDFIHNSDDISSARTAAEAIGIPLVVRDMRNRFAENVIRPFVESYASGVTPNPCVICNPTMKWFGLTEVADEMGIRWIATGHYARSDGKSIIRGIDRDKDQSYFLYRLERKDIARSLFPLGELTKSRTREIALKARLPFPDRGESNEVCFFKKGMLTEFLRGMSVPDSRGNVVDMGGKVIGQHDGWTAYTIGQRKGLGVASSEGRLYVVDIDPASGTIVLGPRDAAMHREFEIAEALFLDDFEIGEEKRFGIQIRHLGREIGGVVFRTGDSTAKVKLDADTFAPAPGQSAVFYRGESVAGGGIIASVVR